MAAETRSRLVWQGHRHLVAHTGSGHEVHIDTSVENGGDGLAAQPLETFMSGLGACSAVDVLSILEKMRVHLEAFAVDMVAPRREEHPRVWTEVRLRYEVTSPDATPEGVRRAVELSLTRYCSASAMVGAGVPLTADIRLNDRALEPVVMPKGA
jgi:putative redox protein